jgi:DNA-binding transcriptional ArsR family regulator
MAKQIWHPSAYLSGVRNVRLGLRARTLILNALEKRSMDAKTIAGEADMHYRVVLHHLKLLEGARIVERKRGRSHTWLLTGVGQRRLLDAP